MKTREKKIRSCDLEVKDIDSAKGVVQFYFGAWGDDLDNERIERTAYAKTLKENKGRIYHNRDHMEVVGNPMEFGVDDKGAWAISQLAIKTISGNDMFEQYKAGIVKGHSQEFETLADFKDGDTRVIKELRLWGITSVTRIPANLDTPTISLKSYEDVADMMSKMTKLLTSGNISDELGERLVKEFKSLSVIIEKKEAELKEKNKPKGIDWKYVVENL